MGSLVICGLSRCNEKDIKTEWEALKHAKRPRIHTFIATSLIHMEHKLRKTKEQMIEIARSMVSYAGSLGCEDVEFSPEDAGRSEKEFLDMSKGQRPSMRDISRGEGRKMKYLKRNVQKKRQFQSPTAKSVQSAAKEFLEKAACDLLCDDNGSIKGLLKAGFSEKDNPNLD